MPREFYEDPEPIWIKKHATSTAPSHQGTEEAHIFLAGSWEIWKARNKLTFNKQRTPPQVTARIATIHAVEFAKATNPRISPTLPPLVRTINWTPPPSNYWKLNSDGAVSESIAAAGGLIRDLKGQWVGGYSMNIRPASIPGAELWGLRQGLFLALQLGFYRLIVEIESLEVVQALKSDYSSSRLNSPLLHDCLGLIQKFADCRIQHIPREVNSAADSLAKLGLSLPGGVTVFQEIGRAHV